MGNTPLSSTSTQLPAISLERIRSFHYVPRHNSPHSSTLHGSGDHLSKRRGNSYHMNHAWISRASTTWAWGPMTLESESLKMLSSPSEVLVDCIHNSNLFILAIRYLSTPHALANMKPKVYQFLVGVFASFGSLLFGYDLGVIAQVIASQSYLDLFNVSGSDSST